MSAGVITRMAGTRPLVWGAGFGAGLFAIAWLERSGRIDWPWNVALVGVAALTLFPLRAASLNRAARCGIVTSAIRRYNSRTLIWAFAYIIALGIALTTRNTWHPGGAAPWLLALLPSMTIAYYVWALWRYLAEEADEYQRTRQINAALLGTGFLLIVASTWGFLELFGVVPHAEGFWAVGVWAGGMGLGNMVQSLADRRGAVS